jgi:hypothetical protein
MDRQASENSTENQDATTAPTIPAGAVRKRRIDTSPNTLNTFSVTDSGECPAATLW